jgi:hypothetical protein
MSCGVDQCDRQWIDDELSVHKTLRNMRRIAIENTARQCAAFFVHLNEFSWTPYARHGMEAQA